MNNSKNNEKISQGLAEVLCLEDYVNEVVKTTKKFEILEPSAKPLYRYSGGEPHKHIAVYD